jgi:hypothetical protein
VRDRLRFFIGVYCFANIALYYLRFASANVLKYLYIASEYRLHKKNLDEVQLPGK